MDPEDKLSIDSIERRNIFLQTLFDTISTPVNYKDLDGRFIDCNQAFANLVGKKKEEIIGKKPVDVWAKSTADILTKFDQDLLSGNLEKKEIEIEYENLFGRKGVAIFSKSIFKDRTGKMAGVVVSINDISDLKNYERKIKENEIRFRSYFNTTGVGIAVTSPTKGWVEVNDKVCLMFGYSKEEMIQKTWLEMTYPEDLSADEKQFNRMVSGEIDNYSLEKRFIRKNKEIFWTNLSVNCVRDPNGKINYIIALIEDITDKKKYEEAFKMNEEKFRKVTASLFNPLIIIDNTGLITYWNEAAEKMFGYKAEEIMGENLQKLLSSNTYNLENFAGLNIFFKTGQGLITNKILEVGVLDKLGNLIPVELSVSPLVMGDKIFAVGSIRDLRENKKLDQEVKARITELERFNRLMINRELKMIELKEELKKYKDISSVGEK